MEEKITLTDNLIISIPEARKVLGKELSELGDEFVEKLVMDFSSIIKQYLKSVPKC